MSACGHPQHAKADAPAIAERAGLSESFLSQVERGRSSASIASLARIAEALGISIADLFQPGGLTEPRVLRREDRPRSRSGPRSQDTLTPRPLQQLEVIVGELDPGIDRCRAVRARRLGGALRRPRGTVELELGDGVHQLEPGDSIDYRSSTPHRISNAGDEPAEVMWIISPPSY